ncbi:LacI family DNA-binding transcriptional regulator [Paenibacillus filicis]|uniref:LacI family DNA-binding transcriptional regulator n=1 Tax=Paenibacillus gyeongsangnamensis TaxID=3388067 RepID=A0ABT4QJT2_9BACL|nr:LacI family DNA-binding transcriptional regulator [Paenibacillus filicis]MCZ8517133.1 LacI family DNA-binding transcriptional regulator [Paenibacillus filicis]
MATIDDVAKLAGVSKGTVSSVFSKKRPISQEVTERVLSVAKELGYFPNHVARSLAIKKTMIAGLKMPLSKDGRMSAFETQMISGVIKECSAHGYRLLLDTLPEHDDPTQFSLDPVDGVIMLNPRKDDPRIARLQQMGIPLVLVGRPDPLDDAVSFVDNNNTEAAYQVGEYLLKLGHRSVLFLNASSDMTVALDRKRGLADAYLQQGLVLAEEQILHYSRKLYASQIDYGYRSMMNTYGKMNYTAVITDTDRAAVGVLRAAREMGIAVPDRLSVIALSNDATLAQETTPRLTSVELSADKLGAEAARLLVEKMARPEVVKQTIIDAALVFRESCKSI